MTCLKACSCANEYQDKKYGKGLRVHNILQKAGKPMMDCRCTVCGNKRTR